MVSPDMAPNRIGFQDKGTYSRIKRPSTATPCPAVPTGLPSPIAGTHGPPIPEPPTGLPRGLLPGPLAPTDAPHGRTPRPPDTTPESTKKIRVWHPGSDTCVWSGGALRHPKDGRPSSPSPPSVAGHPKRIPALEVPTPQPTPIPAPPRRCRPSTPARPTRKDAGTPCPRPPARQDTLPARHLIGGTPHGTPAATPRGGAPVPIPAPYPPMQININVHAPQWPAHPPGGGAPSPGDGVL